MIQHRLIRLLAGTMGFGVANSHSPRTIASAFHAASQDESFASESTSSPAWLIAHPGSPMWEGRSSKTGIQSLSASSSQPSPLPKWQWDEFVSIGRDYTSDEEVDIYDATHSDFRDLKAESQSTLNDWFGLSNGFHVNQPTRSGEETNQHNHDAHSNGLSLIDFGCGTGELCVAALQNDQIQFVHAVDVSTTMLNLAKQKADEYFSTNPEKHQKQIQYHHAGFLTYQHGLHRMVGKDQTSQANDKEYFSRCTPSSNDDRNDEFMIADGDDTMNEKVDLITSTYVLHHLPDLWKGVALERIANLLKDGTGLLYLRDVVVPTKLSISVGSSNPLLINERNQRQETTTLPSSSLGSIKDFCEGQARISDFLKKDAEEHFQQELSTYDWILEGLIDRAGLVIERKEVTDNVICTYLCRKKT